MQILLTNDDGIQAPGLTALSEALAGLGEVHVVAPSGPRSGTSHAVSDRSPLGVRAAEVPGAKTAFAVDGNPADCSRLGLVRFAPGAQLLVSGINAGGNMGVDIHYSGTVGAAREAALLGLPAIAVSQYIRRPESPLWPRAAVWALHVIREILALPTRPHLFWNINLPQLEEHERPAQVTLAPLSPASHHIEYVEETDPITGSRSFRYRGRYQDRPRPDGSDVDVVFSGGISVTLLRLNTAATVSPAPRFSIPSP